MKPQMVKSQIAFLGTIPYLLGLLVRVFIQLEVDDSVEILGLDPDFFLCKINTKASEYFFLFFCVPLMFLSALVSC